MNKVAFTIEEIHNLANQIIADVDNLHKPATPDNDNIQLAFDKLLEIGTELENQDKDGIQLSHQEISDIGGFALELIDDMSNQISDEQMQIKEESLSYLYLSTGLWIARMSGEIYNHEGIASSVGSIANNMQSPELLKELSIYMDEIIEATDAITRHDEDKSDQARPWRIMNINKGIIATRTLDVHVMGSTFDKMLSYIPEEMPDFFSQGMQQMRSHDFPDEVKEVMQRYYNQWSKKTLH